MNVTAKQDVVYALAKNAVSVVYEDLSSATIKMSKLDILDTLAVGLAGSSAEGLDELVGLVKEWGGEKASSILVGSGKVPPPHAALVNGTMAHARDYDDTHDVAVLHAGVIVVPAAFAVAEWKGGVSGKELITAVALGVDFMCRLGIATSREKDTGISCTGMYGYFGAAMAAGKILGLNEERMLNAIGIAYSQCSGEVQSVKEAALTKRISRGMASKGGVLSAILAQRGITGPKNCLEGEFGLFNAYQRGVYMPEKMTPGLGSLYEVVNLSFKPYPCCRYNHAPIDAVLSLVRKNDINPREVAEVKIGTNSRTYNLLCDPIESKRRPHTVVEAQFSLPYTVSSAIFDRRVAIEHFTEKGIARSEILELAQKMSAFIDSDIERTYGRVICGAKAEIKMKDGRVFSIEVGLPKGNPENPMDEQEFAEKFRDCAAHAAKSIPEPDLNKAIKLLNNLEEVEDVAVIMRLLS